jgi:hypothetical protein
LLGVPDESIPMFKAWIDEMTGVDSTLEQRMQAYEPMKEFTCSRSNPDFSPRRMFCI